MDVMGLNLININKKTPARKTSYRLVDWAENGMRN